MGPIFWMLSFYLLYPPKESSLTNSTRGPIGLNALFYVILSPKGEIIKELTEGSHWLSALFILSYPPKESCLIMTYLPTYLPPDRKRFTDFFSNLQIWSLDRKNVLYFGKSSKNFLLEKNPTSSFKMGGLLGPKNQIRMGSRHFFPWKRVLWFFF